MFQESSKDGFAFKAYQGAQMTLLTMDLVQQPPAGAFAGFTLEYTGPNSRRTPIKNLLNFAGTGTITSSVDSPFQAFKWVHFPGSYSQIRCPLATGIITPRRGFLMAIGSSSRSTLAEPLPSR